MYDVLRGISGLSLPTNMTGPRDRLGGYPSLRSSIVVSSQGIETCVDLFVLEVMLFVL